MGIAILLDTMSELKTLEEKFGLAEELCFEKLLSLLGNARERKFIS